MRVGQEGGAFRGADAVIRCFIAPGMQNQTHQDTTFSFFSSVRILTPRLLQVYHARLPIPTARYARAQAQAEVVHFQSRRHGIGLISQRFRMVDRVYNKVKSQQQQRINKKSTT
jgi:hypothetical protein